jgi:glutamate/tyrosine decarboxylase-like PLP-dependent enzyme
MSIDNAKSALRSWFLGPRAENAELLERLVTEALRDHIFWRRNHHPEDGFTIRESDKRSEGYDASVATLTQELLGLLAELKQGVPMFSGRYKGHMASEQTIAAQVAYFAAMLYNPNNVSIEASPVTTRLELEVAAQLAQMVGYDPAQSWGHLTSGGTVANFEALWIARNVLYLPVAAAGAAMELGLSLEVALPDGRRAKLGELGLWELLNVRSADAMDLWQALWQCAPAADVHRALGEHSLATVGYQDYGRYIAARFEDELPASVVLVPATAHYSWEKIVRALGVGSNQLRFLPVDANYRMNMDALAEELEALARSRTPVMGCVAVCGTTEESAVDRIDLLLAARAEAERGHGLTFHVHADACFGGYAASVTWRADGSRRTAQEIRAGSGGEWPEDGWLAAMRALGDVDSVTIDPHKLGYIPFPAGAFLLRDRRARELVAVDPPYLAPTVGLDSAEDFFLGRFIFEGSKPGAAAAAVWLSHKVLPLDERGHGFLVTQAVRGARRLHRALAEAELGELRVILLPAPDINIVCYLLHHPSLRTLETTNALNEAIYARLSHQAAGAAPEYMVTRTRFQSPMYDGAVDDLLAELGVCTPDEWRRAGKEGLVVLRSTVMDPFAAEPGPGPDHVAGLVRAIRRAAEEALRGAGSPR